MLRPRLVACIVVRDGIAVQSIGFRRYLPIGSPRIAAEFLNRWGIDEIVLQDISATTEGRGPNLDLIRDVAAECFVPLTVAGGIRSVNDLVAVTRAGADKVAINSGAFADPGLVRRAADMFGCQCVVVSLDVMPASDGGYEVVTRSATQRTGADPVSVARMFEAEGAGELLLNAVHRDGSQQGYDLRLIASVAEAVTVPIICCGGVGEPKHFSEAFAIPGVTAAAAANYFQFTEHSVLTAKGFLARAGWQLRRDTNADYADHPFESGGRIAKKKDEALRKLIYEFYPEESV